MKQFVRSSGLDTALYKNIPLPFFVEYAHNHAVFAGLPLPGFPEEEPLVISSTIKSSVNFVLMTRKGNRQQVCVMTIQVFLPVLVARVFDIDEAYIDVVSCLTPPHCCHFQHWCPYTKNYFDISTPL